MRTLIIFAWAVQLKRQPKRSYDDNATCRFFSLISSEFVDIGEKVNRANYQCACVFLRDIDIFAKTIQEDTRRVKSALSNPRAAELPSR